MNEKQEKIMGNIFGSRVPAITFIFLAAAPLVLIWYGAFIFNFNNADNVFLYIIQIIADGIAMLVMFGLWMTILMDVVIERHHRFHEYAESDYLDKKKPDIAIFVTVYGEPISIVRRTVTAAVGMDYPHVTYILDDGGSTEVRTLAKELGAEYIARTEHRNAKAGNVNNALRETKSEFFAILDADHVPKKEFITKLLPYMGESSIAMVQSPQHFSNEDEFIPSGTAQAQDVFYRFICPAKNISNSAFSVGTNVIFRRTAIDQIGGIALNNSEDIWTTFQLHKEGWKTLFVNEVLAIGEAPDTIVSFFKQQRRWAKGGLDIFINENPLSIKELELDQRIQYFISSMFFLVGVPIIVYIGMPIIYLLFSEKPLMITDGTEWLLHYLPYFGLYFMLTWLLLGQRIRLATMSTALASFYPYLKGLFSVLFDTEEEWVATVSKKSNIDPVMKWIWPHVFLLIISVLSLIVGWYSPLEFWATFFNSIWVLLNLSLIATFLIQSRTKIKV